MRRREDERIRAALRDAAAPGEGQAAERGWRVVREAFARREQTPMPTSPWRRLGLTLAGLGAVAALALSPAGASMRDWLEDAITGEEGARSSLRSLPASGSLLAATRDGVWIVRDDGSRRRLGDYGPAAWSPNGLYVAAAKGRELAALTPTGEVRWALATRAQVAAVDWSSDEGFRIAYVTAGDRSDLALRIVAGDGTGDAPLASNVGATAVAWQPESSPAAVHRLAYVDERMRVTLVDADSGDVLWRSQPISAPVERLQWSADGDRLLVVASGRFALAFTSDGEPLLKGPVAAVGGHVTLAPDGESLALTRSDRSGRATVELTGLATGALDARVIYRTAPGSSRVRLGAPAFSPDGKWVLVPWPQADQWLFIRVADRRVVAVADISRRLDSSRHAEIAGWCC